jgi:hypothetical protein
LDLSLKRMVVAERVHKRPATTINLSNT